MAHPALIDDFLDEILEGISQGKTLHAVLRGTGLTVGDFYRRKKKNPDLERRYAELRQEAVQTKADYVDYLADERIEDPDCSVQERLRYYERWNPAWRKSVDMSATVEHRDTDLSPQVLRMLDRVRAQLEVEGPIADDGDGPEGSSPGALPPAPSPAA